MSARVLIVHHSVDDRAMYADYLQASGFEVLEADTTDSALALALETDIVVTGLLVPGTFDGIELVRRVRQDHRTRDKGIIVVTAAVTERHRDAARQAGCDAFLPKPCLPDLLVAEVQRVLSARSGTSTL